MTADLGHANGSRTDSEQKGSVIWHGWPKTLPGRSKGRVSAIYTERHTRSTEHGGPNPTSALSQTLPGPGILALSYP